MVFNVSSTVQPKVDVEKPAVNEWGATSDKSLLVATRPAKKTGSCCTALPWILLSICIMLLAGVSCWGWREHKKFQDLLHCKTRIPSHLVLSQGETLSPLLINDPVKIPYGNDALDPEPENDQGKGYGENDVIEHDDPESSDGDDSGVNDDIQGDPEPTPKFPFHFIHFRFPFHFPISSDDGDRVRAFRYRLRFQSLFNPENQEGSGED